MDALNSRQKAKALQGLPAVATTTNERSGVGVDKLPQSAAFDLSEAHDEDNFDSDCEAHIEMSICSKTSLTTVCSAFPLTERIDFESDCKSIKRSCDGHNHHSAAAGRAAFCLPVADDDIEYDVEAQAPAPKTSWC